MNIQMISNTLTLIALIIALLLYMAEFIIRWIMKRRFTLFYFIIAWNAFDVALFLVCQIPLEETILFLLISATISLLLCKKKEG